MLGELNFYGNKEAYDTERARSNVNGNTGLPILISTLLTKLLSRTGTNCVTTFGRRGSSFWCQPYPEQLVEQCRTFPCWYRFGLVQPLFPSRMHKGAVEYGPFVSIDQRPACIDQILRFTTNHASGSHVTAPFGFSSTGCKTLDAREASIRKLDCDPRRRCPDVVHRLHKTTKTSVRQSLQFQATTLRERLVGPAHASVVHTFTVTPHLEYQDNASGFTADVLLRA
jgi:hypothetical protein